MVIKIFKKLRVNLIMPENTLKNRVFEGRIRSLFFTDKCRIRKWGNSNRIRQPAFHLDLESNYNDFYIVRKKLG